jgi:hypothetical protein
LIAIMISPCPSSPGAEIFGVPRTPTRPDPRGVKDGDSRRTRKRFSTKEVHQRFLPAVQFADS